MTTLRRFFKRGPLPLFLIAFMALSFGTAGANANIVIINNDAAGEGFNDPTPVAPVGGNPGVTVGQQRLNVFQRAADIWGQLLLSSVTIEVRAQFDPQTCSAGGAVLGSAGPITVHRDDPSFPLAGHWYHAALANALAGVDLNGGATQEINSTFNSNLGPGGSPTCPFNWYLGLDGNEGNAVELLPVVLHELGHGLGFSTTTSGASGFYFGGFPSVFDNFLFDPNFGLAWNQMNQVQRQNSAIGGTLVWSGVDATNFAATFLANPPRIVVNSPPAIAGQYDDVQAATYGPSLTLGGTTGDIELVNDGVGTASDGCEPLVGFTAGRIALIDRGNCSFVQKSANAQAAGAIAVIVANNAAGGPAPMGGTDPTATIPSIGTTLVTGNTIKSQLPGVNATLSLDPAQLAGADANGNVFMYTPNPFQGGSSVSHWDTSLLPNALMEPSITQSLSMDVDLTLPAFTDIGWNPKATPVLLARFIAEGRDEGIALSWQFSDISDAVMVGLQRTTSEDGPWSLLATNVGTEPIGGWLDADAEAGLQYHYRLQVVERDGSIRSMGFVTASRPMGAQQGFALAAPWPNPSKLGATINFSIGRSDFVRLNVIDASGRLVRTLQAGMMEPGSHSLKWDGRTEAGDRVGAGLYFVNLRTSEGVKSQRMAVVN